MSDLWTKALRRAYYEANPTAIGDPALHDAGLNAVVELVAEEVRRHCTIPSELAAPNSDRIVYAVADWIADAKR